MTVSFTNPSRDIAKKWQLPIACTDYMFDAIWMHYGFREYRHTAYPREWLDNATRDQIRRWDSAMDVAHQIVLAMIQKAKDDAARAA